MLRIHETVPDEFVDADPEDLVRILGAPSLMHLDGRRREPLFVSVLLHGNELTGL